MSTTVVLDDEQLENVRREMMKAAAESLEIAAKELRALSDMGPWGAGSKSRTSDAIGAVHIARVDLDSLEALGWPENDRGD